MDSNRLFLVGCPRSGTTLLQSMVASHSQVVSFPETHFFSETLPINKLLRRLKIHGSKSKSFVRQFLESNNYPVDPFESTRSYYFYSNWCEKLIEVLDSIIEYESKHIQPTDNVWGLEKTPRHLHYISSIARAAPESRFLHILRHGPDVVASMHLATKEYPEQWDGQRSVEKCIQWWNNSIRASMKYRDQRNHHFVTYEQLIEQPAKVLKSITSFLGLEFEESMIDEFHQTASSLTTEEEQWKDRNEEKSLSKSKKIDEHFDSATISYIEEKTLDLNLTEFYH